MESLQALGGFVSWTCWCFRSPVVAEHYFLTSCDRLINFLAPCLKYVQHRCEDRQYIGMCWVSELDGCFMRVCDSNWFVSSLVGWLNHTLLDLQWDVGHCLAHHWVTLHSITMGADESWDQPGLESKSVMLQYWSNAEDTGNNSP